MGMLLSLSERFLNSLRRMYQARGRTRTKPKVAPKTSLAMVATGELDSLGAPLELAFEGDGVEAESWFEVKVGS